MLPEDLNTYQPSPLLPPYSLQTGEGGGLQHPKWKEISIYLHSLGSGASSQINEMEINSKRKEVNALAYK